MNIFICSLFRICLDSTHGIQPSVAVDNCNFLHTSFQGVWFLISDPMFRILSILFFSYTGWFFWLIVIVCGQNLFFIGDIRGKCAHFNECYLNIFQDFETCLFRDFELQSGEKVRSSVHWNVYVCCFEVELQHIVTSIPQRQCNCFRLEKTCHRFVICQNNC